MKKSILTVVAALLLVGCGTSEKAPQNVINQEEVMVQMSLEDKAHFVIGTGMQGFSGDNAVIGATRNLVPGAAGTTYPLDSKGHKYTYLETDGGHIWRNWRIYLSEFTPLLFK